MAIDKITIKGAREHNLKNIDLEIPKNKDLLARSMRYFTARFEEPCLLEGEHYARR